MFGSQCFKNNLKYIHKGRDSQSLKPYYLNLFLFKTLQEDKTMMAEFSESNSAPNYEITTNYKG